MTSRISLDVQGSDLLVDAFSRGAEALDDDTDAMRAIGQLGRQLTFERFAAQGRPLEVWEPPSEATRERRLRDGIKSELALVETGVLRDSFSEKGNSYSVLDVDVHVVAWGSKRKDFQYHQKGTLTEPRRRMIGHTQENLDEFAELYLSFVSREIAE